jgi:hypothetical protein
MLMKYIKDIALELGVSVDSIFNLLLADKKLFALVLDFDGLNVKARKKIVNRIKRLSTKAVK